MSGSIGLALAEAQQHLEEAKARRIFVIERARDARWTWMRIGQALGMSDVAALRLYERAKRGDQ